MNSLPFGIIDVCFVAILVISGILAYIRGFVREVLSVAAWVGATLVTLYGYPHLQTVARDHIENRMVADVAAGGLLFVGSLIIFSVIASVLSHSVRESAASGLDRSLGFAFGVLRGVILISLLYLSAVWFWDRDKLPSAVTEARTYSLIDGSAQILLSFVPNDARKSAEKATGAAKDAADRAVNAEKTLRGLMEPQPATKPLTESPKQRGYGASERSEMQRLIESKQ